MKLGNVLSGSRALTGKTRCFAAFSLRVKCQMTAAFLVNQGGV